MKVKEGCLRGGQLSCDWGWKVERGPSKGTAHAKAEWPKGACQMPGNVTGGDCGVSQEPCSLVTVFPVVLLC